jgi:hypothetical protein
MKKTRLRHPAAVMAGLVPAIHVFLSKSKTWMPATSAGMTKDSFVATDAKRPRSKPGPD